MTGWNYESRTTKDTVQALEKKDSEVWDVCTKTSGKEIILNSATKVLIFFLCYWTPFY
jgi:hypothetical protein